MPQMHHHSHGKGGLYRSVIHANPDGRCDKYFDTVLELSGSKHVCFVRAISEILPGSDVLSILSIKDIVAALLQLHHSRPDLQNCFDMTVRTDFQLICFIT
jgi:hypothetical protein